MSVNSLQFKHNQYLSKKSYSNNGILKHHHLRYQSLPHLTFHCIPTPFHLQGSQPENRPQALKHAQSGIYQRQRVGKKKREICPLQLNITLLRDKDP
jgi:hypothetical protein